MDAEEQRSLEFDAWFQRALKRYGVLEEEYVLHIFQDIPASLLWHRDTVQRALIDYVKKCR
jgi:hypothetical protein